MAKRRRGQTRGPGGHAIRALSHRALPALREFLADEAAGGVLLLVAAVAALIWANSAGAGSYVSLWEHHLTLGTGSWAVDEPVTGWVNDGLMAVFFFVVGLEIKRELAIGELSSPRAAITPALAALGGVLVPAGIYILIAGGGAGGHGWGVPMATDIAFAVGILTLLGRHVGSGAKLFLLSIAIVDDLIAITVIAIFYSDGIKWAWIAIAVAGLLVVVAMRSVATSPWFYLLPSVLVWFAMLESGIHATVAGVLLGLLTPAGPIRGREVMDQLQSALHPISAFVIVPVFALANAGVDLRGGVLSHSLGEKVTWAVAIGLVAGKLIGVAATTFLLLKLRIGTLPMNMVRAQIWPIAALCGIGFTVALFVSDLAFDDDGLADDAKVGIFIASFIAAAVGALLLRLTPDVEDT
ncbi:MAG: Na+/H+ antiporter NhaA [Jatrophihabitantaceae bacterium]